MHRTPVVHHSCAGLTMEWPKNEVTANLKNANNLFPLTHSSCPHIRTMCQVSFVCELNVCDCIIEIRVTLWLSVVVCLRLARQWAYRDSASTSHLSFGTLGPDFIWALGIQIWVLMLVPFPLSHLFILTHSLVRSYETKVKHLAKVTEMNCAFLQIHKCFWRMANCILNVQKDTACICTHTHTPTMSWSLHTYI